MKKWIIDLFHKYKELVLYIIVGCGATLINIVVSYALNFVLGTSNLMVTLNSTIAWLLSTTFGFILYKLVVFESKSKEKDVLFKEITGFYGARIFSLGLEWVGMYLLNFPLPRDKVYFTFLIGVTGFMIAKLIMIVIVTISNYIFSKFVVFKHK